MIGMLGDIDGDGWYSNMDITILLRFLAGWDLDSTVSGDLEYTRAYISEKYFDINSDGKITNRDIIALIRKLAGID